MVKDIMCGDEAAAARSMLQITYPVRRRRDNWRLGAPGLTEADGKWNSKTLG